MSILIGYTHGIVNLYIIVYFSNHSILFHELNVRTSPSTRGSSSSSSEMAKDNLSTHSVFVSIAVTGGYFHASMMMFPSNSLGHAKTPEDLNSRSCLTGTMIILSGSGFSLV